MTNDIDLADLARRAAAEGVDLGNVSSLATEVANVVFRKLVAAGELEVDGRSPADVFDDFNKAIQRFPEDHPFWEFAIDYTPTLLREAQLYREREEPLLSCLMYATWLEHWVNALITDWAPRSGISDGDRVAIIRESNFPAKLGWLLRVLGLPELEPAHRRAAIEMVTHRNGFVHHKYKTHDREAEARLLALVTDFDETVRYLEGYYVRNLLSGLRTFFGPNEALEPTAQSGRGSA